MGIYRKPKITNCNEVGLNRVQADVFSGNVASEKVLLKCGMQKEGVARERYHKGGVYIDAIQYAILQSDWRNEEAINERKV